MSSVLATDATILGVFRLISTYQIFY